MGKKGVPGNWGRRCNSKIQSSEGMRSWSFSGMLTDSKCNCCRILQPNLKFIWWFSDLIVYYNAKNYKCERYYEDTFFIIQLDAFEMLFDRFDRVMIRILIQLYYDEILDHTRVRSVEITSEKIHEYVSLFLFGILIGALLLYGDGFVPWIEGLVVDSFLWRTDCFFLCRHGSWCMQRSGYFFSCWSDLHSFSDR